MSEDDIPVRRYRIVKDFLVCNNVKKGWQDLILHSVDLTSKLEIIIEKYEEIRKNKTIRPEENKILNALSYAEPADIKVVIIGTSPAATDSIASGLAFSSNRYESQFRREQAIGKVHEALRAARILTNKSRYVDYHCGHQEWAKNGVLLLNAALTITKADREDAEDIKFHCDLWKCFLQQLLLEWLIRTPIHHKLFVMRWGYALPRYINYAQSVWSLVADHRKLLKVVFNKDIHTFQRIHHPTCPASSNGQTENNFLDEAPDHFKKINDHYENIFYLQPIVNVAAFKNKIKKIEESLEDLSEKLRKAKVIK